ncbi:hypothetical protein [Streptomyces fragilis]|uniref:hypothetical protein n=1 Tax=Streptomyces fragilis TaxID=67301 RepID=UPI0024DEBFAD|nr:hypothetical protein [Streptomyces fragilis]
MPGGPVSYTHLEVYKRQASRREDRAACRGGRARGPGGPCRGDRASRLSLIHI